MSAPRYAYSTCTAAGAERTYTIYTATPALHAWRDLVCVRRAAAGWCWLYCDQAQLLLPATVSPGRGVLRRSRWGH